MALIRKQTVYTLSVMAWGLVVFGATILVGSGNAEPYVSLSDLPTRNPIALFGGAIGAWLLGWVVVGRLSRRDWKRTGRRAGLAPVGGGLTGKPDLEGTVGGRTVRMRTITRNTGSSTRGGSSKVTYTVVEVDLADPVDNGILIQVDDTEVVGGMETTGIRATDVGDFGVIGAGEKFSRAVLTDGVREALRKPSRLESVLVGDVSEALTAAMPDDSGWIVSKITEKVEEGIFGDGTTVRVQQKGVLLDGTELSRQIDALVAVADSFEAARRTP